VTSIRCRSIPFGGLDQHLAVSPVIGEVYFPLGEFLEGFAGAVDLFPCEGFLPRGLEQCFESILEDAPLGGFLCPLGPVFADGGGAEVGGSDLEADVVALALNLVHWSRIGALEGGFVGVTPGVSGVRSGSLGGVFGVEAVLDGFVEERSNRNVRNGYIGEASRAIVVGIDVEEIVITVRAEFRPEVVMLTGEGVAVLALLLMSLFKFRVQLVVLGFEVVNAALKLV